MIRHRQVEPLCPFLTNVNGCGNVPMLENMSPSASNESEGPDVSAESADAADVEEPDNRSSDIRPPDYMDEQVRLDTFTNWPVIEITIYLSQCCAEVLKQKWYKICHKLHSDYLRDATFAGPCRTILLQSVGLCALRLVSRCHRQMGAGRRTVC